MKKMFQKNKPFIAIFTLITGSLLSSINTAQGRENLYCDENPNFFGFYSGASSFSNAKCKLVRFVRLNRNGEYYVLKAIRFARKF